MAFFQGGQGFLAGQAGGGSVIVTVTQDINLASDVILIPAGGADIVQILLTNDTGLPITLTGAPQVQNGAFVGQQLLLRLGVGSNAVNLSDETAVPGSKFQLTGTTTIGLSARRNIWCTWTEESTWLQTGNLVAH